MSITAMLKHETQQEPEGLPSSAKASLDTGAPSADNARVTAEEFTAAIQAIEKRRANEEEHKAGTVMLGETIRELNIDASPEQILAEVEAERARKADAERAKADEERAKTDVKARAEKTVSVAWDYASAAYATIRQRIDEEKKKAETDPNYRPIGTRAHYRPTSSRHRSRGPFSGFLFSALMVWLVWSFVTGHIPVTVNHIIDQRSPAPGIVMPLSAVPAAQTVYCTTDSLVKIINSGGTVSGSAGAVSMMSREMDNTWPIVVHGGKVYVQGFTLPSAGHNLSSGVIDIYNDDNSGGLQGNEDVGVTVPLAGIQLDTFAPHDGWSELMVEHIKIDSFTHSDE